ncbi:hypothetical protein EYC84_002015 [Monilinia fructicola]|uniref:Uncharacterized protein n=1 Tax=Monilinia fructicola TaxID=38448 RepID=A0A5M9JTY8_MONFR|nr:hypothetical protein EYC84_002015 [Monilinia fructicola]
MDEQVMLLNELSKLYNEQLATARNLATPASNKTTKDDGQKRDDGKIPTPEREDGDRSSFEFVEAPELAGNYESFAVGNYQSIDASGSVAKPEIFK